MRCVDSDRVSGNRMDNRLMFCRMIMFRCLYSDFIAETECMGFRATMFVLIDVADFQG